MFKELLPFHGYFKSKYAFRVEFRVFSLKEIVIPRSSFMTQVLYNLSTERKSGQRKSLLISTSFHLAEHSLVNVGLSDLLKLCVIIFAKRICTRGQKFLCLHVRSYMKFALKREIKV